MSELVFQKTSNTGGFIEGTEYYSKDLEDARHKLQEASKVLEKRTFLFESIKQLEEANRNRPKPKAHAYYDYRTRSLVEAIQIQYENDHNINYISEWSGYKVGWNYSCPYLELEFKRLYLTEGYYAIKNRYGIMLIGPGGFDERYQSVSGKVNTQDMRVCVNQKGDVYEFRMVTSKTSVKELKEIAEWCNGKIVSGDNNSVYVLPHWHIETDGLLQDHVILFSGRSYSFKALAQFNEEFKIANSLNGDTV